ncbi:hypothetical protein LCGC14_1748520 [marine sediment metagenome]|uniref:Uncharacterized protein n=1 Tax=marine sediment metagenome TaxID=412755 RepID=A0A0F9H4M5_9ZZZZ
MVDSGTLATTAQVKLAIGENPSTAQALEANTNIWILFAESDMEKAFGNNVGLVANIGSITAANKQWLAMVASHRAAFYGINHNQDSWQLAVTQSKLNVCDSIWIGFLSDLTQKKADIVSDLGLTT